MTQLRVFHENAPHQPLQVIDDHSRICSLLSPINVTLERWAIDSTLEAGVDPHHVLAAYRSDIERIRALGAYQRVDVLSVSPDHPQRAQLRAQFLDEHTHEEDEVRFFVAGSGLFTLHNGHHVYELRCVAGDFIFVPGGMRHWFDMGAEPSFVVIRFLGTPDGWIAHKTGSPIAQQFVTNPP